MSLQLQLSTLRRIRAAAANKEAINKQLATACEKLVKSHFRELASTNTNKLGARGGFWKRMFTQVQSTFDRSFAYVSMNRAIAQRYFGGTIKPTGTKRYLTIPISKTSYNRKASWFDDLEFYTSHLGNKFLVLPSVKRGKKTLEFLYLLKERVTQKGDKKVLPTREQFRAAMAVAFQDYMKRRGA